MESRHRNKTKQSLRKTYKFLVGFLIVTGLLISSDNVQARGSVVSATIMQCNDVGSICSGITGDNKQLPGDGSITAATSWKGEATAMAALSVATSGSQVQLTETVAGTLSAGNPDAHLSVSGTANGNTSLILDLPVSAKITLEISYQLLLSGPSGAGISLGTLGSDGRFIHLFSDSLGCSSQRSCNRNFTTKLILNVIPSQEIFVSSSTQGGIFKHDGTFQGNVTVTVRVIGGELRLEKISGDAQKGPVGTPLPKPLVVKVTDGSGNPVSGKSVNWTVTGPNGALGQEVSPASSTTGSDGKASTTLTLGDLPGDYIVQATCADCTQGSPQTFTATATAEACTQNGASIGSQVGFLGGNLFYTKNLISLSGTGPQVNLTLAYNSIDNTNSSVGPHWTYNYAMKIERDFDGFITLKEEDGKRIVFVEQEADLFVPIEHFGRVGTTIERLSDARYQLRRKEGTNYIFDPTGKLNQIQDRNLNTLSLVYNGDNIIQIIDASGRITSIGYDSQGRIISITDPAGRVTTLDYSAGGFLSRATDPSEKATLFTYDSFGLMLTRTDPDNNQVDYGYDVKGRLISVTDASGIPATISYQPEQNQAIVTDRDRGITTYLYDPILDKPLLIIAPDGGMTSNLYDAKGNLTSTTDPAGNTTGYTYDGMSNLITITDPQGGITRYSYDPIFSQVTSITDPNGNITAYTYDGLGNLMTVTDPTGGVTGYSYDTQGRLIRLTNSLGQTTTFTYDTPGNLISIIDPSGATTTMTYDEAGNMISRTDPNGATTFFEYDALNRLIKTIDPLGNATTFTYDARGNRISQTDAMGRTTLYEYNYQNKLIKVIDPQGGVTSYTYDAKGNLKSITDANGSTATYGYDSLNRLISETDPLGNTISYSYDKKGNLTQKTDANGQTIAFTYDSLNRLIRKSYPDGGFEA